MCSLRPNTTSDFVERGCLLALCQHYWEGGRAWIVRIILHGFFGGQEQQFAPIPLARCHTLTYFLSPAHHCQWLKCCQSGNTHRHITEFHKTHVVGTDACMRLRHAPERQSSGIIVSKLTGGCSAYRTSPHP